jgi:hypothetical protein
MTDYLSTVIAFAGQADCVAVPLDAEHLAPLIDQADRDMYRGRREAVTTSVRGD